MPSRHSPFLSALALVTSAFAIAGCATEPPTIRADGGAPVCTRSYPVGSNLPTTTCVSAETAAEQKRRFDQDALRTPIQMPKSGGG